MAEEPLVAVIIYLPKSVARKLSDQADENDRTTSAEGRRILVKALKDD